MAALQRTEGRSDRGPRPSAAASGRAGLPTSRPVALPRRAGRSPLPPALGRAGKRWQPEEDERLLELAGTVTSRELARQLGRSVRGVEQRLRQFGLSPHDADGRYTAAELGRALGIPGERVDQWCRLGLIPAQKVGRGVGGVWRIDWDGRSPIGPAGARCRHCGVQLLDGRRRYCERHRRPSPPR